MVRLWLCGLVAALWLSSGEVHAQTVERAPTPSWVMPLRSNEAPPPVDATPIRILVMDQQIRFTDEGIDTYTVRRIRVQSAQGLGLVSTVNAVWTPPRETVQVHSIRIFRGDQVIDVLDSQKFETLRRENNLESSMLDGKLTATLQPRDLRVGDILETSFTIHDNGGVLAPHRESLDGLGSRHVIDRYRLRATWPDGLALRVQGIGTWSDAAPRRTRDGWEVEIDKRDVQPSRLPDDLPARLYFDQTLQLTDFVSWAQASARMAPLYAKAETLEADSPLVAEIERIRAESPTPAVQAAAALRLVQDQVRYVALSMGEGGYVPANADDVWRSRYGDCKGKTALLMALLNGLGIKAEPALVSTSSGDDLDKRLPLMSWFDHVIVRAEIDGQTYWLDGTRIGDRNLSGITPPSYQWALPVRAEAADLVAIVVPPATTPAIEVSIVFDASEGLDAATRTEMDMIMTGDTATAYRDQVARIPPEQLEAMLKSSFESNKTFEVKTIGNRYDDATNTFHLLLSGTLRLSWIAGSGGRFLAVDGTVLQAPTQAERSTEFAAWKDAPYSNTYPSTTRMRSRIILPGDGKGFRLEGGDQVVESGGYRLERTATLAGGVAEIIVTQTSLTPEVSAADMKAARTRNETLGSTIIRLRAPSDYQATDADRQRLASGDSTVDDLIERAERLSAAQDHAGAIALLDAALEKEPENVKALVARGAARRSHDDFAGAREDYDRAADLDPADIGAVLGQGRTALSDGRPGDAVVAYSVALRLEPGNLNGLLGRASAYYRIERWDRALTDYRALKTAAPDLQAAWTGEVWTLLRLARFAEARALADEALAKQPTDSAALNARLRLAKLQNKPSDALEAIDTALAEAPGDSGLLTLRAKARVLAGDERGAREDFGAVRALAGADPVALNNLCWAQAISGFDAEAALADCDAAVAGAPDASAIDSRALVLLNLERYAEARAAYETAVASRPNQAASIYGLGLARLALGDEGGKADLTRAQTYSIDVGQNFEAFIAGHPDLLQ